MLAAVVLGLCDLGTSSIYYSSEQKFYGQGSDNGNSCSREPVNLGSVFGGGFGAFRSHGQRCSNESHIIYAKIAKVIALYNQELAPRRGRRHLREVSGNSVDFGLSRKMGNDKNKSIVRSLISILLSCFVPLLQMR